MFDPDKRKNEPASGSHWGEIVVAISTVVLALVAANIEGLRWLVYACLPLILVAFILMLAHSSVGKAITRIWHLWRDERILKRCGAEYCEFVEEANVVEELMRNVENLVWMGVTRPDRLYDYHALVYLKTLIGPGHFKRGVNVQFVNLCLYEHFYYCSGYLAECDRYVRDGRVAFQDADHRLTVQRLVGRLEEYKERHNRFCKKINFRLRTPLLMEFYGRNLCFEINHLRTKTEDVPANGNAQVVNS